MKRFPIFALFRFLSLTLVLAALASTGQAVASQKEGWVPHVLTLRAKVPQGYRLVLEKVTAATEDAWFGSCSYTVSKFYNALMSYDVDYFHTTTEVVQVEPSNAVARPDGSLELEIPIQADPSYAERYSPRCKPALKKIRFILEGQGRYNRIRLITLLNAGFDLGNGAILSLDDEDEERDFSTDARNEIGVRPFVPVPAKLGFVVQDLKDWTRILRRPSEKRGYLKFDPWQESALEIEIQAYQP